LSRPDLFQKIKAETALKIKIIVQTKPIKPPDGVQGGIIIVLYHSIPRLVKTFPAQAASKTKKGMTK